MIWSQEIQQNHLNPVFVRKYSQRTTKQQRSERIGVSLGLCFHSLPRITNPSDWENALSYPLSPFPLCLSTADGKPRKIAKSKLQEVVFKEDDSMIVDNPREVEAEWRHNSTYIVDLMAALRQMVQISENYEELTWKLLSSFPKGFQRVDIVADTFRNVSIKAGEREIVDAEIRLSSNRLSPRYQKISELFCEMVKIRTGS